MVLVRDLRVGIRRWTDASNSALFFILVVTLFPLALSPRAEVLRAIAPGVLWIAALLATLLSLHLLFRADLEDGTLEQLLTLPYPAGLGAAGKDGCALDDHRRSRGGHGTNTGHHLPFARSVPWACWPSACCLGTPTLSLLGSIGAALTAGLRGAGVLLAFIVAPLMVPVLILGARATDLELAGADPTGPLYLLAALLVLATSLVPIVAAGAIRISAD